MSTRKILRMASLALGASGLVLGLAGCGAEAVKEAAPPPINAGDATDPKRLEMMRSQSRGSGTNAPVEPRTDVPAPAPK